MVKSIILMFGNVIHSKELIEIILQWDLKFVINFVPLILYFVESFCTLRITIFDKKNFKNSIPLIKKKEKKPTMTVFNLPGGP